MRFFDENFRENKSRYIAQAAMGGLAVAAALMLFDVIRQPVIIASFGASAFIAFTMPRQKTSRTRYLVGGYIVGIVVGVLIHRFALAFNEDYMLDRITTVIAGGVAVCLAIFIMSLTDTEHAPATSIALGFVINDWSIRTPFLVLAGIIIISVIQRSLRSRMIDLL